MASRDVSKIKKSAMEGRKGFYMMSLMYFNLAKDTVYDIPGVEMEFKKAWVYFQTRRDELEAFFASFPDYIDPKEHFDVIDAYLRDWPEEGCSYDLEGAMSEILHVPLAQVVSKYSTFFMNVVASVESYTNLRIATLCAHGEKDAAFLESFERLSVALKPEKVLERMGISISSEIKEAVLVFGKAVRIRNSFVHHHIRPAIFSTRHFSLNDIIGEPDISFDFCLQCLNAAAKIITSIGADFMYAEEMAFKLGYRGFQPMCAPSPYFQQIPPEWDV